MQLLYYMYYRTHFVIIVTLSCADSKNSGSYKIKMNDKTKKAAKGSYICHNCHQHFSTVGCMFP